VKRIQSLFSKVLLLVLLLALAIGLVFLLSNPSQNEGRTNQPSVQAFDSNSPLPTPTLAIGKETQSPVDEKATSTPTVTPPTTTSDLPDDVLEPTWTSAIVLPEGTSPPRPTPLSTPTATPVNPKEELLVELQSLAGQLAISPDDQEIAFSQVSPDESRRQLWKLNLADGQTTILSDSGIRPQWSPDGQSVLFERTYWEDDVVKIEVKMIKRDGQDERSLLRGVDSEVLDYYWVTSDRVGFVSPGGIEEIDLTGKVTRQVKLALPAQIEHAPLPPVTDGSAGSFVVLDEGRRLQIVQHSGERVTITDPQRRELDNFSLSPDKQRIAYIVSYGPLEELWVADLSGKNGRQLFELPEGGRITVPCWSPDGQSLVIGHQTTGTHNDSAYELTLINVNNGYATDLQVDGIGEGFVWSHDGKWLYYTRYILTELPATYDVTLHRLRVQQ
jgi:dipeptidyl aminopeptidase/acylaminoacyl peptidase